MADGRYIVKLIALLFNDGEVTKWPGFCTDFVGIVKMKEEEKKYVFHTNFGQIYYSTQSIQDNKTAHLKISCNGLLSEDNGDDMSFAAWRTHAILTILLFRS